MIIRALSDSGDWEFGSGLQSFLFDEAAIELNIRTRLLSFFNDAFWNMTFGIDWFNLLGSKNPSAQQGIILQTRQTIIQSEGVVSINSVSAVANANTRVLDLAYDITTIFSRSLRNVVPIG